MANYIDKRLFSGGSDTATKLATPDADAPVVINTTAPTGPGLVLTSTSTTAAAWADLTAPEDDHLASALIVTSESTETIPIGAVSEGQFLRRVGGEFVGSAVETRAYLRRPENPHANDDEFEDGDPDLAARGWLFRNLATNSPMVHVGDIDWTRQYTPTLGLNEYRSRISGGRLFIQFQNPVGVVNNHTLYKPFQLTATGGGSGARVWARVAGWNHGGIVSNPNGQTDSLSVGMFGEDGGFPTERDMVITYKQSVAGVTHRLVAGRSNMSARGDNADTFQAPLPLDILGVEYRPGTFPDSQHFGIDTSSGFVFNAFPGSTAPLTGVIKFGGVQFVAFEVTSIPAVSVYTVDFIRFQDTNLQGLWIE